MIFLFILQQGQRLLSGIPVAAVGMSAKYGRPHKINLALPWGCCIVDTVDHISRFTVREGHVREYELSLPTERDVRRFTTIVGGGW